MELTEKQIVQEIDEMNKDGFNYVGVHHVRSGDRAEVESHAKFIKDLKTKPFKEIKIRYPQIPGIEKIREYVITIEVGSTYINIYKIDDVKDKIEEMTKQKLSKHKCIVMLK